MNEHIESEIRTHCYMIERGCKPASCMPIQNRYVGMTIDICRSYNVKNYLEKLTDGWMTVWFYKYEHMLDIIRNVPDKPETAYDHWVLGKLFGYDEESIGEFILKQQQGDKLK
ncbi:hypothetical protein D3C74_305350 [compost metagenome]